MSTQKKIIAKGRYNSWNTIEWLSIILIVVLIGLSVFLFSSEELRTHSIYPVIAALFLIIFIVIQYGLRGNFYISNTDILWKTNYGKIHTVLYEELGDNQLEYRSNNKTNWLLFNKEGKRIKKFRTIHSLTDAGASILLFRYKDFLPEIIFDYWTPNKKGKRTYQNIQLELKLNGELVFKTLGTITLYTDRLLFIPTQIIENINKFDIVSVHKAGFFDKKAMYLPDKNILTNTLVEAVLESDFPPAIRDSYLQKICDDNGGQIFVNMKKDGKQWKTFNEGIEVCVERA
ncbi:MAG: hypothetical protein M9887_04750 [Chitinophagales bacterium]|nr:hypothetical protein [Chitinophagales bacterium]